MRHGSRAARIAFSALAWTLTLALAACATAPAGTVGKSLAPWRPVGASTGQTADIAGLESLAEDFPDSGSVLLRRLNALLEAERNDEALAIAAVLMRGGYSFSPAAVTTFSDLAKAGSDTRWLALNESNAAAIENSRPIATIPAEARLVESVWRDAASGDLFATTVVSRALFVSRGGTWQTVPIEGAGSLSGMAYDAGRGILWIASGVFEQTPERATAFSGLIAIDPKSGAVVRRVAGAKGSTPSDMAVDGAGRVYASDPLSGAVYVAGPGDVTLARLVEPGALRSPQG